MRSGKKVKAFWLNVGIAIVNVILFSPGLLGINLQMENKLLLALGLTICLMSVVVFFVGNYKLLIQKNSVVNLTELETEIDYIKALEEHADKKTFIKETTRLLNQIEKLQKKKEVIHDILRQRFNTTEMTYAKFNNTLVEIENIFYLNIKSILNKLNVFDQEEYNQLQKEIGMKNVKREFIEAKLNIYGQYITFIKGAVEDNDQILIKLDELLLELSKLNSLEDGELEEMNAMKELDALISKTKLYR